MIKIDYEWDEEMYQIPLRDSQKGKVYNAESILPRRQIGDASLEAVTAYVRRVEASTTWRKLLLRSGLLPVVLEVRPGNGCSWARGGRFRLTLPQWARSEAVVLHEMAHAATPGAGHNWPFAAAFLSLVQTFMGKEAAKVLKASFKECRVKYKAPRKLTPERLAQLRALGQRLAASRRPS